MFLSVTFAPATAAPDESVTEPRMEPLPTCAPHAKAAASKRAKTLPYRISHVLMISRVVIYIVWYPQGEVARSGKNHVRPCANPRKRESRDQSAQFCNDFHSLRRIAMSGPQLAYFPRIYRSLIKLSCGQLVGLREISVWCLTIGNKRCSLSRPGAPLK